MMSSSLAPGADRSPAPGAARPQPRAALAQAAQPPAARAAAPPPPAPAYAPAPIAAPPQVQPRQCSPLTPHKGPMGPGPGPGALQSMGALQSTHTAALLLGALPSSSSPAAAALWLAGEADQKPLLTATHPPTPGRSPEPPAPRPPSPPPPEPPSPRPPPPPAPPTPPPPSPPPPDKPPLPPPRWAALAALLQQQLRAPHLLLLPLGRCTVHTAACVVMA
jgi:hypothetical protein